MQQRYRPQTVLVVEDDPHDREIYGKILWYNGYDVEYAEDAAVALDCVHDTEVDLVVLDIGLPAIDGLEFCRVLREDPTTARIPIVVLSAYAETELGTRARAAGCNSYLEKPRKPLELLQEVERLVGTARRLDDGDASIGGKPPYL